MPQLPTPLRAFVGLAVTICDEARRLPDRAIEVPMLAVSSALQMSLHAQQRYAALAARGDAALSARHVTDEPPEWARFDDELRADETSELDVAPLDPAEAEQLAEAAELAVAAELDDEAELVVELAEQADLGGQVGLAQEVLLVEESGLAEQLRPLAVTEADDAAPDTLLGAEHGQPAADGVDATADELLGVDEAEVLAESRPVESAQPAVEEGGAGLETTPSDAGAATSEKEEPATSKRSSSRSPRRSKTVRPPRNARPSRFDVVGDE